MSSEQLDGIWKCLYRSGSRSQPRQGPKLGRTAQPRGQHVPQGQKLGRKRRWRGFPGAPSGAGRGVSPRVPRIGAELGAGSRLRPADGVWGRGGRGDMFGRGSYTIVRRCKSSIFSVAIRSEMEVLRPRRHTGVRWRFRSTLRVADTAFTCEKEVPLDAARCRHSVHLREGGSARRCASRGMTCRARGERGKRWAAEMVSLATERLSPPPIFSLPLIRRRTSFRRRRQEVAESHPRQSACESRQHELSVSSWQIRTCDT